jgi:LacI family transcriptional regulator
VLLKRPTIKDVAKQAGLSLSTVSLVLNKSGQVSEKTQKRVLDIIDKLGYHPSHSARRLASKTSGNIGFILTEDHFSQAEPFYTRIFLGTEFEARNHNYYILLTTVDNDFKKNHNTPRFLLERNVDGVIVAGKISDKLVDYIHELGIPVVLVDYELKRRRFSSVLIDNRRGAAEAVRHLTQCGHKDIAFIGGDIDHPSIAERYEGFKEVLAEHAITPGKNRIDVDEEDTHIVNGYNAMQRILKHGTPSAVFAANDAMAIGCMQYVKQSGLKIPGDVAVVGFDDIDISSHTDPRLSTVRVFKEEMGKVAVQRMVEIIKSKTQIVSTSYVHVELVMRESTGCEATAELPFSHP